MNPRARLLLALTLLLLAGWGVAALRSRLHGSPAPPSRGAGGPGFPMPPPNGGGPGPAGGGPPPGGGGPRWEPTAEQRSVMERHFQAQLAKMMPKEREKAEKIRRIMETVRQLPPEERRGAVEKLMAESGLADEHQKRMKEHMRDFFLNSSVDQRVDMVRHITEMKKREEGR